MQRVVEFADRRPFMLALLALLVWMILASLITAVSVLFFDLPLDNAFTQLIGTISATAILLIFIRRLDWFHMIGITNFGSFSTWALTIAVGIYLVFSGFYAYFGELTFEPSSLFGTQESRAILLQALLVGFVEETIFRGVLLFVFVRIWGKTKRGLIAGIVAQAALFGILHALQAFYGVDPATTSTNVLATFIFGIWLGVLVLYSGSLWPAIFLHAASNAFILIKGLSSPWIEPIFRGYVREALFELPIVLIGLWVVVKTVVAQRFVHHSNPKVSSNV